MPLRLTQLFLLIKYNLFTDLPSTPPQADWETAGWKQWTDVPN